MNIAIIFAGGVGKRMQNTATPKQFLRINDKPIIIHTLEIFERCDQIDKIIVVMVESHVPYTQKLVKKYNLSKVEDIVNGGETGQLSIYNGLLRAKNINTDENKIVLIHDGVRPFIDEDLILRNIESVKKYRSAISCVKQNETTVLMSNQQSIDSITDRDCTYIARAPQSFYLEDILECHTKYLNKKLYNAIDSCTMMISLGKKVHLVECNDNNIKITTPIDFYIAKALFAAKENIELFGG